MRAVMRVGGLSAAVALTVLVGALVALVPSIASVLGPSAVTTSSSQQTFAHSGAAATTNPSFESIPAFRNVEICAPRDGVTATLSLILSGGSGEVRIVMIDRRKGAKRRVVLQPGPAPFAASAEPAAFSFTYLRKRRRALPPLFRVEWRATSGDPVELQGGTVRLLHGSRRGSNCG